MIDRDDDGVSGEGDEWSTERDDENEEEDDEPAFEPECSASERQREEVDIECEFIVKDGSWWCNTHNCAA